MATFNILHHPQCLTSLTPKNVKHLKKNTILEPMWLFTFLTVIYEFNLIPIHKLLSETTNQILATSPMTSPLALLN